MLKQLLAPQLVVLYILAACTLYVHFRGRHRLRLARQLGDHSTYLAPYNVLMYAGSAIPSFSTQGEAAMRRRDSRFAWFGAWHVSRGATCPPAVTCSR